MFYARNLIMEKRVHIRTDCAKRRISGGNEVSMKTSNRSQLSTQDQQVIKKHIKAVQTGPVTDQSPSPHRTGSETAGLFSC